MVENPDINKQITKYLFCNNCRCKTEHSCKGEQYRDYPNYQDNGMIGFVERVGYRFWICSGCKTGLLEESYIFDALDDHYKDESTWEFTYYPVRNEFQIKSKEFKQLNDKLNNIYRETLGAYNNNLNALCALGIRSLLEGICADKGITGRDLKTKINNMVSILPQNIVTNLHSIRFIGNEAAHELDAPSNNELNLAVEICEDLLNFIYELDYKARNLTTARMQRKRNMIKNKHKTQT
jgi:hypothetical protein